MSLFDCTFLMLELLALDGFPASQTHHFGCMEETATCPKQVIFIVFSAPGEVATCATATMRLRELRSTVHIACEKIAGAFYYLVATFCEVFQQRGIEGGFGITERWENAFQLADNITNKCVFDAEIHLLCKVAGSFFDLILVVLCLLPVLAGTFA